MIDHGSSRTVPLHPALSRIGSMSVLSRGYSDVMATATWNGAVLAESNTF